MPPSALAEPEIEEPIQVPRDKENKHGDKVTKDIEAYLLDLFSENNEEPFPLKELTVLVRNKFSSIHGWDLEAHVAWACDMLHANHLIKRVAPGVWEADEGPDEVYSERQTGYAPEGEFAHRGQNFNLKDTSNFKSKAEYNHELGKADWSVNMLKNMGKNADDIKTMLSSGDHPYNPVALKIAIKKHFEGVTI
jgi:hypothetical protein